MRNYTVIVDMEYGQDIFNIEATDMRDALHKVNQGDISKYAKCVRILEVTK